MPVPVMMGPMGPMMAAPMPAGMMPGAMAAPQLTQMLVEAARGGRSSNVFFKTRICNKQVGRAAWGIAGQYCSAAGGLQCQQLSQAQGYQRLGVPHCQRADSGARARPAWCRWRAGACPYGDKCT